MKKRVIAVGFFDGVHNGHLALMKKACEIAHEKDLISAVFTFKKHPDEVVFGNHIPLITTDSLREATIKKYGGVDEVFFWDFDKNHSKMPWDEFTKEVLLTELNADFIVTGEDFKFGYKGLGNSKNLKKLLDNEGVGYFAVPQVIIDDLRVSSSSIRALIESGDIETANKYLAHPYEITGEVIHGRAIGRTIGIPTANIKIPKDIVIPPKGVYATTVIIDGKKYLATTNFGTVPTFMSGEEILIEAHILDFSGDLYGKTLTVSFYKFLRAEKKFESIDALKNEILKNINETYAMEINL